MVGDLVYGRNQVSLPVDRQLLHAHALRLQPPDGKSKVTFEAPLPPDFREALLELGADPGDFEKRQRNM